MAVRGMRRDTGGSPKGEAKFQATDVDARQFASTDLSRHFDFHSAAYQVTHDLGKILAQIAQLIGLQAARSPIGPSKANKAVKIAQ